MNKRKTIAFMAKLHNGMRPQDIVVLLKKISPQGYDMLNKDIASSIQLSPSEVSDALERCRIAQLLDSNKSKVNTLALKDFLVYGLRYVYPIQLGGVVRGIATAVSAPPISDSISGSKEVYVWPHKKGNVRGQAVQPLYATVPEASINDEDLYRLLVITDTLRMGRVREKEVAIQELDKYINAYVNK